MASGRLFVSLSHPSSPPRTTQYGVTCNAGTCAGTLTRAEAEKVLAIDIADFTSCVQTRVKVGVTQNQFDALVSFSFNVGCGAFAASTLLSKLNAGTLTNREAQFQLSRWHSSCTEGLKRRRFTESLLYASCASVFDCSSSECSLSQGYTKCANNCQYCQACAGECSGSTTSVAANSTTGTGTGGGTTTGGTGAVVSHATHHALGVIAAGAAFALSAAFALVAVTPW